MKKIRINRAKWRTGDTSENKTGKGDTSLLNPQGFKCCLGFIGCQVSKKNSSLFLNEPAPGSLSFTIKNLSKNNSIGYIVNTDLSNKAMNINDNPNTTPKQKETKLKRLFKNVYELEFYGEYTKCN